MSVRYFDVLRLFSVTAVGQRTGTYERRYLGLLFETAGMPDIVLTQACLT